MVSKLSNTCAGAIKNCVGIVAADSKLGIVKASALKKKILEQIFNLYVLDTMIFYTPIKMSIIHS